MQITIKINGKNIKTFGSGTIIPQDLQEQGLEGIHPFKYGSFFGDWCKRGVAFDAAFAAEAGMNCIAQDGTELSMIHVAEFRDGSELILRPGYKLRHITENNTVEIICSE